MRSYTQRPPLEAELTGKPERAAGHLESVGGTAGLSGCGRATAWCRQLQACLPVGPARTDGGRGVGVVAVWSGLYFPAGWNSVSVWASSRSCVPVASGAPTWRLVAPGAFGWQDCSSKPWEAVPSPLSPMALSPGLSVKLSSGLAPGQSQDGEGRPSSGPGAWHPSSVWACAGASGRLPQAPRVPSGSHRKGTAARRLRGRGHLQRLWVVAGSMGARPLSSRPPALPRARPTAPTPDLGPPSGLGPRDAFRGFH